MAGGFSLVCGAGTRAGLSQGGQLREDSLASSGRAAATATSEKVRWQDAAASKLRKQTVTRHGARVARLLRLP